MTAPGRRAGPAGDAGGTVRAVAVRRVVYSSGVIVCRTPSVAPVTKT